MDLNLAFQTAGSSVPSKLEWKMLTIVFSMQLFILCLFAVIY